MPIVLVLRLNRNKDNTMTRNRVALICCAGFGALGPALEAPADFRNFSFVYESATMPEGKWEYEQWVTWKTHKGNDSSFDRLDFRHEFEFGVTDRFQLAFYLPDWRYEDGRSVEDDGAEFRDVAVEAIFNLSDAADDPLGSALYGEIKFGDEIFELEGKLILDKQFGQFKAAYNLGLAAEWEGSSYDEDKGEFEQALGLSYELSPSFALGAELLHELEFADWSDTEDDVVWLGPNASYRQDTWYLTLTPLFQVTDVDSEADFQTRLLFGFTF